MRHVIKDFVKIPEGIEVIIQQADVEIKGKKGTLKRNFSARGVILTKENNNINIEAPEGTLREKRTIKTFKAHLNNMIKGIQEGYVYELKICSGHFPMNVSIEANKKIIIKNFLGEKVPRQAKIDEGVAVKIEGDKILCESIDKEKAGATAARIELSTNIKGRDRRIFQDGIYIVKKAESATA